MSIKNGKADDDTDLAVPVTALYHERSLRELAEGRAADAERKVERLERELAMLREELQHTAPDSPLAKREALRAQLAAVRTPR